jgi:hypothetical protein
MRNVSDTQEYSEKTYKSNVEEEIPCGRIGVSEEVPQIDK